MSTQATLDAIRQPASRAAESVPRNRRALIGFAAVAAAIVSLIAAALVSGTPLPDAEWPQHNFVSVTPAPAANGEVQQGNVQDMTY